MDDRFLHELRRQPRPEFARALRARLRAQESRRGPWALAGPWLAALGAALLAVALFTMPSVRASAQALLDLFRVRRFAAVRFDESRLERLRALGQDNTLLVFDRVETLLDPGRARPYAGLAEAEAAAGMAVLRPGYLPNGLLLDSVYVEGTGHVRLAVSEAKLRGVLDQLDLGDVSIPPGLDGQWVEVRKSPVVVQRYRADSWQAGLVQGVSPEVSVPAGLDVERLAEIGLRILGLDSGEARRIARTTDWRTTLLVPVPVNASTFRQVTIHGQPGLLITTSGRDRLGASGRPARPGFRGRGTIALWTEGDRVFGLMSNLGPEDAMQMAESVR
jgi:hypothetical protein